MTGKSKTEIGPSLHLLVRYLIETKILFMKCKYRGWKFLTFSHLQQEQKRRDNGLKSIKCDNGENNLI